MKLRTVAIAVVLLYAGARVYLYLWGKKLGAE